MAYRMGPRPATHNASPFIRSDYWNFTGSGGGTAPISGRPNPSPAVRAQNNLWLAHLLTKRHRKGLNRHETILFYCLMAWKRAQRAQWAQWAATQPAPATTTGGGFGWSNAELNPILGIAIGTKQTQAKATGKAALYRNKYLNCRGRRTKKNKPLYPEDPGQKHCKSQYNKWTKWRGKAGKRSAKLSTKLDNKGKLTPEAEAAFAEDIRQAEADALEDLHTTSTSVSAQRYASSDSPNYSEAEALEGNLPEGDIDADGYPIDTPSETSPMVYVGVGLGVLAVLGIGLMALR